MTRFLGLVFIGVFGWVLPTLAMACPAENIWGNEQFSVSGPQLYEARSFEVVAGGTFQPKDCDGLLGGLEARGGGFFASQPDFSFELTEMRGFELVFSVESECDTQLLVHGASVDGYFDDDDNGNLDPRVVLTRPPNGILDVWVGTYESAYCDAVLTLETFARG